MLDDFAGRLARVDAARLAPLVEKVLQRKGVRLRTWSYEPLNGGFGRFSGVLGTYRFQGTATAEDTGNGTANGTGHSTGEDMLLPWSLVLKVQGCVAESEASPDPAAWGYWKREALAYQSGLLADLPPGITAPRCLGYEDVADNEAWLWLEYVTEDRERLWPIEQYALAARDLGRFNGAYLAGRALPRHPWLTGPVQGEQTVALIEPCFADLEAWCRLPEAAHVLPAATRRDMAKVWEQRQLLLHALGSLPRCFCHKDAMRRNLLARRAPDGTWQTTAIDWALAGVDAVGEDPGELLMISLAHLEAPIDRAQVLHATILEGYLAGLEEAGWDGDPEQARLGYTIAAALAGMRQCGRDLFGISAGMPREVVEGMFGHTVEVVLDQHAGLFELAAELGHSALAMVRGNREQSNTSRTDRRGTGDTRHRGGGGGVLEPA